MKKPTNISRVMDLAKDSPNGFTTVDVRKQIKGINSSSMHALLWKLKKGGALSHDVESGVYKLANAPAATDPAQAATADVSTPVNKNKPGRPKKERQVPVKDAWVPRRIYNDQTNQLIHTQSSLTGMRQRYEDALAIIRYLEEKLLKAIQFDARNGRNT
jgi:hypothetical protein